MLNQKSIYIPTQNRSDRSEDYLYFDIETTGLSKQNALIYLIGCAWQTDEGFRICQWFAENPDEERAVIAEFSRFAASFPVLCTYNGTGFDLPFLSFRAGEHGLADPCAKKESRDLYRLLSPCRKLFGLPDMKQRSLEEYLSLPRQDRYTGKDCVGIYRELIKYRDIERAKPLLLHNLEDLRGLVEIESLTSCLSVSEGAFALETAEFSEEGLRGVLNLKREIPRRIALRDKNLSLFLCGDRMEAVIPMENGLLKNYYADYRNYYYLPAEDTAVHKSVGGYVAKSRRQPATRETCYTKFRPGEAFLRDRRQLERYFQNNIPLLLGMSL